MIWQGHPVDCRGRRSTLQYHVVTKYARKLEFEWRGSARSNLGAVRVDVVVAALLPISVASVQLAARLAARAAI